MRMYRTKIPKENIKGLPKHIPTTYPCLTEDTELMELIKQSCDMVKDIVEKYEAILEYANTPPKTDYTDEMVKISTEIFKLKIGAK